jgi:hypothetical protein
MRPSHALRLAALAAAMLAATAAQAQLFKCVNSAGRTVYQDAPCDDKDKQTSIRAPAASAPAPAPQPSGGDAKAPAAPAPARPAGPSAVDMVAGYTVCAERVPNFEFKYSANYESWKARNAASMNSLASEPDASRLDARLREEREKPEGLAERCAGVATALVPPATAAK